MLLNQWDRYRDQGLLILRIGLGLMFIYHGWPKIHAGPHLWHILGMATELVEHHPTGASVPKEPTDWIGRAIQYTHHRQRCDSDPRCDLWPWSNRYLFD